MQISCSIVYEGARALRDWLSHTQRSLAAGAMYVMYQAGQAWAMTKVWHVSSVTLRVQ